MSSFELPPISPEWSVLESSTHPGKFYEYNPTTGENRWLKGSPNNRPASLKSSAASDKGETFTYSPQQGRKTGNYEWSDPKAKEFYEKGKAAERRMFYSQSECGDVCGHEPECMCSICICGNHQCPPVLRHIPYPNLKSEYMKKYPGWDQFPEVRKSPHKGPFKPKPAPGMYDRRQQAVADGQSRNRPLPEPVRPQLPFDGQTEYKDSYVPKRGDDKAEPPRDIQMDNVPFSGTTEHRDQFTGEEGDRTQPIRPSDPPFQSGDFKGQTEHRRQFTPKKSDDGRRGKQLNRPWKKGPPRDISTTYKDDYVPNRGQLCPARLLPHKKPGSDDHMHYHFTGQYNKLGDPLYIP